MVIKRYEIYFADLSPTVGSEYTKTRPVLVVSKNEMNKYLDTVVVCPLTTQLHPMWQGRVHVEVKEKSQEIAIDQIRTISKKRLKQKLGKLDHDQAFLVRQTITEMYGEAMP